MKNAHLPLVMAFTVSAFVAYAIPPVTGGSDSSSTTTNAIVARGPNHRIWQKVTTITNALGNTLYLTNSYTELATGMHFWNGEQWVESSDQIQITQTGAAATNGQHHVSFTANINSIGAVDLVDADGHHLCSHILGLSYYDASTSNSVLIAELQDSIGQVFQPGNQVLYTNAFTDFQADVRYTYKVSGLEQDIILRQQPPSPAVYGLNPASTRLQVWTEFTQAFQPEVTSSSSNQESGLTDQNLAFGVMKMIKGKAFDISNTNVLIPISKSWNVLEGRSFLVEEVPLNAVAASLQTLPAPPSNSGGTNGSSGGSSLLRNSKTAIVSASPLHRVFNHRVLPPVKVSKKSTASMQLAANAAGGKGLVLDYNVVNGSITNFIFQCDSTYFITNAVYLYGTNIIEGGAVIKYSSNSAATMFIAQATNLTFKTDIYRPAIFTASDDDSIGSPITGSTGIPTNYYYGGAAIESTASYSGTNTWKCMRFSYFRQALHLQNDHFNLYDVQIIKCREGLYLDTVGVAVRNALFYNVKTNFNCNPTSCYVDLENVTVHGDTNSRVFNLQGYETYPYEDMPGSYPSYSLAATNCLFVGITELGTGLSIGGDPLVSVADCSILSSDTGIFQTAGSASHYLADSSPYRQAGTTNINTNLLVDLHKRTTFPPVVIPAGYYSYPLVMFPQAGRDYGSTADLGYHYDPLDYAIGGLFVTNATLTAMLGTAIGIYCTNGGSGLGLAIDAGAQLVCQGTANHLCHIANYNTVQEQSNTNWFTPGTGMILPDYSGNSPASVISCRFTDFSIPAKDTAHIYFGSGNTAPPALQDCQLHGGTIFSAETINFLNCLLERVDAAVLCLDASTPIIRDNLFYGGGFEVLLTQSSTIMRNNMFDRTIISDFGASGYVGGYNGYYSTNSGVNVLTQTDSTDVFLTNSVYLTSWLGNYYIPTNSPLINKGSTTADLLGLYHYTMLTTQVKETNSIVDIGFHYVAVDSSGNADDTDGDGTPDYLEDASGNGAVDSGETDWNDPNDLGLRVIITRPKNNSIIP